MQLTKVKLLFVMLPLLTIPVTSFSLPKQVAPQGEKMVLVDPRTHAWGAYDARGRLVREGLASLGADWCEDVGRPCRTIVGSHRVRSLGARDCVSPSFPLPHGGAPMHYCMYFNKYQALHGSYEVAHANISHGCVRMRVADARWLRYHFVERGTLVVVLPY
jgi:lipoprotein-anchoring transpeptidase ErfK/SrfK